MDSEAGPTPQSDDAPVVTEPASEPVFSDLISRWLDEGDRLGHGAGASEASAPVGRAALFAKRWAPQLERLREIVDRHRLLLLAGLGFIPMALFLVTHRAPPPTPAAVAVRPASRTVRLADVAPKPAPAVALAASSPTRPAVRPPSPAVVMRPVAPAVRRPAPIASTARPIKRAAKAKKIAMAKRHPVAAAKAAAPPHPPVVASAAKRAAPSLKPAVPAPKVAVAAPRPPAPVARAPKLIIAPLRQPASPKAPHVAVVIRH